MAERCPACDNHVDDTGVVAGGILRCARCGARFAKAKKQGAAPAWNAKDDVTGLGIHPALAKKYRDKGMSLEGQPAQSDPGSVDAGHVDVADSLPPSPLSPPRGASGAPPQAPGPGQLASTRVLQQPAPETTPGRPSARSLDPPRVPAPPPRAAPHRPAAPPAPAPAAAPPPSDPVPRIPGYEIVELVGKGAMGRVYRARNVKTGQHVAIKILAPELAARPDFIARFEREGAALRAVNHRGVVAIEGSGSAPGTGPLGGTDHFLSMAFVEGHPMRKHLEKGALPIEKALRFARKILDALGAAHDRGVIHRDLKPENILVTDDHNDVGEPDERLVLVDFGLAGIVDEDNDPHPNLTKSRMTMGTVNYMAPEQRTDAKRVDHRADLYAAGVILYELLTGDLPLGRFALPTERGVPLPQSIDRVIVQALARNPDERYQSAKAFDDDVKSIERDLQRQAHMDTVVGRARPNDTEPGGAARNEPASDLVVGTVSVAGIPEPSLHSPDATGNPPGTAMISALPWLRPPTLAFAAGALVLGTTLGLLALRGGCGGG